MNLIVCLDDNGGMLFNNRRQSRDRTVTEDILATTSGGRLLISSFSESLFVDFKERVIVDDNFLDIAKADDFCFVENRSLDEYETAINSITIYRWNRIYPRDFTFPFNLTEGPWSLISSEDFPGYSHDKITKDVYKK